MPAQFHHLRKLRGFQDITLNIVHLINHFLSVFKGLQNFKLLYVLNSYIIKEITQHLYLTLICE